MQTLQVTFYPFEEIIEDILEIADASKLSATKPGNSNAHLILLVSTFSAML